MEEGDVAFEEDVVTEPYSLRAWLRYLKHKRSAAAEARDALYERALAALPGSYKMWRRYLTERVQRVRSFPVTADQWAAVGNVFERALVFMHKMPRMWLCYLEFLFAWHAVSRVRPVTDRALQALPITQHARIWEPVLEYVSGLAVPIPATGVSLWRRYLNIAPARREDYVEYLMAVEHYDEAAKELVVLLDTAASDSDAAEAITKPRHELWLLLCSLISEHAPELKSIPVEAILRTGVTQFSDQVGTLWTSLGDYFIRLAQFDKARDVYEEGMAAVTTVRDFTLVFDAYVQFEDAMLSTKLQMLDEARAKAEAGAGGGSGNGALDRDLVELDADLQLRFERYQHLIDRRPLLVNAVLLRQNPSNVHEWLKRVELYKAAQDGVNVVDTYTRALEAVEPATAAGPLHELWIGFASFYELAGQDADAARAIYERAVAADAASVDSLVAIWLAYAEFEGRVGRYDAALALLQRATTIPKQFLSSARRTGPAAVSYYDDGLAPALRLFKSSKLWAAYVDLAEALGTLESTKAVYEEILELRVATPKLILNYAGMLLDAEYFEQAFAVFERGIELFGYPHVLPLWRAYLTHFVRRYGGSALMRTRQLFTTALQGAPRPYAKELYLQAIAFEAEHGSHKREFDLYAKAVDVVPTADAQEIYTRWIKAAAGVHGVSATRPIYEQAIAKLNDSGARAMSLKYAQLELAMGDLVRARALYAHASQFCPPDRDKAFWAEWEKFESNHGNEDTFREMLRIKRSVRAQYHSIISDDVIAAVAAARKDAPPSAPPSRKRDRTELDADAPGAAMPPPASEDEPAAKRHVSLAPGASRGIQFVASSASIAGNVDDGVPAPNPDAIAMDDSDDSDSDGDDGDEPPMPVGSVPEGVFS
ncbi:uncharacterized protein AMSG_00468 [Thecamonas trahens ATCC 50062]|uniref:Pre-mRNA-splicing factor SYF1 n=1 Tax=Thecamonas trahens ATCC 50062 TaxID=461836 RepID=A0A0L0D9F9_THETB|nr:hypothetical protein AMSG_00468 [Thecamonas trahens ATCC 50062]KNC48691.1 hypothetical protein AMSG_00468 [Thecamonas trahens ATCC 50062]|eukprot:XP_013762747.1 hypothetical protein AMSG_00468 [Thecamonas trahens ATCC 50062]